VPRLPALLGQFGRNVAGNPGLCFDLVDALGSPLHVLLPEAFADNIRRFCHAADTRGVGMSLLYAMKVNKSQSLLAAASACGIGADVASAEELGAALSMGIPGHKLSLSGPRKHPAAVYLALRHGAAVVVDSVDDLNSVIAIADLATPAQLARIMIRLSGFSVSTQGRSEPSPLRKPDESRFGVDVAEVTDALDVVGQPHARRVASLEGFAFHIDNHSIEDRARAAQRVLEIIETARGDGHERCSRLNAGGGFSVRYVQARDWAAFLEYYVDRSPRGEHAFMYRGRDFGSGRSPDGSIARGNFYPYDVQFAGDAFLGAMLDQELEDGRSLARRLVESGVHLTIEPGKALADQAGLTLTAIRGVKRSPRSRPMVICEMNVSHLWEQMIGSEFAVDPLFLPRVPEPATAETACHLAGNLCLESDILSWRPVTFPALPAPGDLLAFINTAGYQSDFFEATPHRMPAPNRVAFLDSQRSKWKLDRLVQPIDLAAVAVTDGQASDGNSG
jgi:diaminopimelate decarboxylase